jgi:DNA-directed RNA polymerase specialized sigma24 family protein
MADTVDQGENTGNGDAGHRSLEEVAAALEQLSRSRQEQDRIERRARILVRGMAMGPGDLVNIVVELLLSQRRHWHRQETLSACFYRTMNRVRQDYWRREQQAMVAVNEAAAGRRDDPGPERWLSAREELERILELLSDDQNTCAIALAVANGETPAAIRERYGLTETAYDSALKRIRRKLMKEKASGGQA